MAVLSPQHPRIDKMRVSGILSLFSLSLIVQAAPLEERANPVAVFLLAGDSTTATQAANGGGMDETHP